MRTGRRTNLDDLVLRRTGFFLFTAAAAAYESEPEKTDSKKGKNAFCIEKTSFLIRLDVSRETLL